VGSSPSIHTASFSAAAAPEVSGKAGAPGASSDDATTVAGAEEKDEPIQKPFTADEKGGTGVKQEVKSREDLIKENEDLLGLLGELEALLEEKERALKDAKDKLLRSYAEMENLRDRTRREAEATRKYAVQDFAKSILDVADNLGRALEIVQKSTSSADDAEANAKLLKSLTEGVEMTDKQLLKVFEKHGLERFNPEGEPFDPNEHQAVYEVDDDAKTPGTVGVVLKAGYKLNDRVIRPAIVGVVKEKAE
jgi:molecular chaperone GrpE